MNKRLNWPKSQIVNVEVIALTDKGPVQPAAIEEVVARRMSDPGYTIIQESSKPADVVFKVKCEQKRTWEGTTAAGGDADLPDAPSRLWKGPACQLTYLLGGIEKQMAERSADGFSECDGSSTQFEWLKQGLSS